MYGIITNNKIVKNKYNKLQTILINKIVILASDCNFYTVEHLLNGPPDWRLPGFKNMAFAY